MAAGVGRVRSLAFLSILRECFLLCHTCWAPMFQRANIVLLLSVSLSSSADRAILLKKAGPACILFIGTCCNPVP